MNDQDYRNRLVEQHELYLDDNYEEITGRDA